MADHTTNIRVFLDAATASKDNMMKAYCGLVAIELVLKQATGLKDHNVPSALNKFARQFAIDNKYGCRPRIMALSTQISNALQAISVQGTNGKAQYIPEASYPNIRYIRHATDGWPNPAATDEEVKALSDAVDKTRSYLSTKFDKPL